MEVTFVRHAESVSNVTGHWQGQGESELSDLGRRQARALGERLAAARFDRVVCSDLTRCRQTAAALGLPIETSADWREIDVGAWEGLTRPEVAERFPDQARQLLAGALDVKVGGGESWVDLFRRVDAAFDELRARLSPGDRALVVTHGGVLHGLLSGLLGLRERRPRPIGRMANTSVTTVRLDGDSVELVRFNDVSHLGPSHPWARERLEAGDTVVTLVACGEADGSAPSPDDARAGRMRDAPRLLDVERLGGWYAAVDHVVTGPDAGLRNAAAVFAERQRASLGDDPVDLDDLSAALDSLAARHGPSRIAVLAGDRHVAEWARGVLGPVPRVAAPRHAAISHVVTSGRGQTLADYNVRPAGVRFVTQA